MFATIWFSEERSDRSYHHTHTRGFLLNPDQAYNRLLVHSLSTSKHHRSGLVRRPLFLQTSVTPTGMTCEQGSWNDQVPQQRANPHGLKEGGPTRSDHGELEKVTGRDQRRSRVKPGELSSLSSLESGPLTTGNQTVTRTFLQ